MSFTRTISQTVLTNFKNELSSKWKDLYNDIQKGEVFPTIRQDRFDLYYGGGKLFRYDKDGFHTHIKYASVITGGPKDYITESEIKTCKLITDFNSEYKRIKENCSNYAGEEAIGVSQLYKKFPFTNINEDIVVLDIEVSLESLDEDKSQDRIDVLLFKKSIQELKFVEMKLYSNSEIRSTGTPKVVQQINRYIDQIDSKKKDILEAYISYINCFNDLLKINLPQPLKIHPIVELIIFGFDRDQQNGNLQNILAGLKSNNIDCYSVGDINSITDRSLIQKIWK
jgi:hypothetical protein